MNLSRQVPFKYHTERAWVTSNCSKFNIENGLKNEIEWSGEQCGTQASCFKIYVLLFHFSEVERNLIKQMVQFTQSHRSTSVLQRRKLSRRTMIKVRVHKLYIVFFFKDFKVNEITWKCFFMNIFCKCLCVNHTVYQLEYSSQKHCIRFATTLSFRKRFLPYEMLSQIKVGLHYQVMVLERKGYKRTYFISVCFELTFFFLRWWWCL